MRPHYLHPLFQPHAIAVIGASDREGSAGQLVYDALFRGFDGAVYPINPRHREVNGRRAWPHVRKLPATPDLAVITTRPDTWPAIMADLVKAKIPTALLLSHTFVAGDPQQQSRLDATIHLARQHGIRVLGPTGLGMLRPIMNCHASVYQGTIRPGNVALISQSSGIATAILDWADAHQIGFSMALSIGQAADIDFGEVLDYLVADHHTRAILLYVEGIQQVRSFMSALRAAARSKPVLVIKAGRHHPPTKVMQRTHSAVLVESEAVFDAALYRAGIVRVRTVSQLFTAARLLVAQYRTQGRRLAVVSNGAGGALLAVDRALDLKVQLPVLGLDTQMRLQRELDSHGELSNPVDLLGDAPAQRFERALAIVLEDAAVDGVLVVFTPQAGTDHMATAAVLATQRTKTGKPILVAWMGEKRVAASAELLEQAHVGHFRSPEQAAEAFYMLARYQYSQHLLMQTPGPLGAEQEPDIARARDIILRALAGGCRELGEVETKEILACFHIPVTRTQIARSADQAVTLAAQYGAQVVLKIEASQVLHKSAVNGVRLRIFGEEAIRAAFQDLSDIARSLVAEEDFFGISVQPMHHSSFGRELIIGVARDAVFGPVITFGAGGVAVEMLEDRALALPPLNEALADNLIRRTRVKRLLGSFSNWPAADTDALKRILLRVSEMVCELPWIREMDLNPVIVDDRGAMVVDAKLVIGPHADGRTRYAHMAIHPYPTHLERDLVLRNGTQVTIRPIRPEDAAMQQSFVEGMSEESRYNRYFNPLTHLTTSMLVRFTQVDYAREMALVVTTQEQGQEIMLAVARFAANPDAESCEFAVEVADRWQGHGIGRLVMDALFDAARAVGYTRMEGEVLASNAPMLAMMHHLGFEVGLHPEDSTLRAVQKVL